MRIAAWILAVVILLGAIGGLVYLGSRDGGKFTPSIPKVTSSKPIKNPEASSGKQTYYLEVDGLKREFVVYRPKNLSTTEEIPVVFMFHGSGGNGPNIYQTSGWSEKADAEGFMVVYPSALRYRIFAEEKAHKNGVETNVSLNQTKWNSYELPGLLNEEEYPDQVLYDDVKFTRSMVEFINENYAVDQDRFYATGFSNGAQFTLRLAVEMSEVFAAYAPTSSGQVPDPVLAYIAESDEKPAPRPIIQVLGADDPKIVHAFGGESLTLDESAASEGDVVYDRYIGNYLALENLANEYTYEKTGTAAHFTYDQSLTGDDNEYQIYIVDNMGHLYPNGNNFRFDVADLFWPFFEQYSL